MRAWFRVWSRKKSRLRAPARVRRPVTREGLCVRISAFGDIDAYSAGTHFTSRVSSSPSAPRFQSRGPPSSPRRVLHHRAPRPAREPKRNRTSFCGALAEARHDQHVLRARLPERVLQRFLGGFSGQSLFQKYFCSQFRFLAELIFQIVPLKFTCRICGTRKSIF